LTEVWMGDQTMREALAAGTIHLDGRRPLVGRFPDWLGRHPILAQVPPAASRVP
jgi:hypothetical protein